MSGVEALQPVREQLTRNPFNLPQPFASPATPPTLLDPLQTARQALELKRGLRDQFVKNWNPDAASVLTRDSARSASGVLDSQLDNALGPQFAQTNQEISSLIPVADKAESISRSASIPQNFTSRLRAHTGALTSAMAGAAGGAATHGLAGGVIGGALGLALPEMLGSPTAIATLSRGLNTASKAAPYAGRAAGYAPRIATPNFFMYDPRTQQ